MRIFVTTSGELHKRANEAFGEEYAEVARQIRNGTYEFCDWLEKQGGKFIGITNDGLTYTTNETEFNKLLDLFGFRRENGTIEKTKGKRRARSSHECADGTCCQTHK